MSVNGSPAEVVTLAQADPVASLRHDHPDLSPGAALTLLAMRSVDWSRDWSLPEVAALMNTSNQKASRWLAELRAERLILGCPATVMGGVRMRYEVVGQ